MKEFAFEWNETDRPFMKKGKSKRRFRFTSRNRKERIGRRSSVNRNRNCGLLSLNKQREIGAELSTERKKKRMKSSEKRKEMYRRDGNMFDAVTTKSSPFQENIEIGEK